MIALRRGLARTGADGQDSPSKVGPESLVFPWAFKAAEVVAFFCRRLYVVDVEPLHELVADGDALVPGLSGVDQGEEGEAGVQFAIVFGIKLERYSVGRVALGSRLSMGMWGDQPSSPSSTRNTPCRN